MRCIWLAILIAFAIQVPFLILMNLVGIHSTVGGIWVLFYLPATWLLDITGVPNMPAFANILVIALFQEVILGVLILSTSRFSSARIRYNAHLR